MLSDAQLRNPALAVPHFSCKTNLLHPQEGHISTPMRALTRQEGHMAIKTAFLTRQERHIPVFSQKLTVVLTK